LKILHLADRFPGRGGADAYLLDWMRSFASEEQRLLVGRGKGTLAIPVEVIGKCKDLAAPDRRLKNRELLLAAMDWADQVHLHNVLNPLVIRLGVASGKAAVIVQDHRVFCPGRGKETLAGLACSETLSAQACSGCFEDTDYGRRIIGLTQDRLAALAGARLVVLSQYMAKELGAVGLGGAAVHPPMVPVQSEKASIGTHFLMGGRMVSHKGIEWGVQGWVKSGVDAPLHFAGVGPLANAYPAVKQLGWLKPEALREELQNARAFLFPARWQEPYGILGVEALAAGTPVVLMKTGGSGEWAREGVLVVDRGNVEDFALAIRSLWENAEQAQRLGQAGQAWVRRFCSQEVLYPKRLAWLYGHTQEC
jgi:hypothetical protein